MTTFRVAQKILLFNQNQEILLLEASKTREKTSSEFRGMYDLPGGGLNIDEVMVEGVKREVKEEIGDIKFEIVKLIHAWDWININYQQEKKRTVCLLYEAKYYSGDITISKEHDSYHWVKISDLFNKKYKWHKSSIDTIKKIQKLYKNN